ncbi:MAG: sulfite exporter TauE/SafE family protein, partial [Acidimicrobiales bacterium]
HHLALAGGGLVVGFLVGLTGAGGGAVLTPLLIIVFGVPAVAAVGSDLAASLVMKPVGGLVHLHHRTVRTDLVRWLSLGSIPGALLGAVFLSLAGSSASSILKPLLGLALLATSVAMILRRRPPDRKGEAPTLRPWPTAALGLAGGLLVGLTSVGSGSLMLIGLTLLYPTLTNAELVGTDLVQAVPLVAAATLGHILFGHVRFGVTAALLVGAIPGVYVGAKLSAQYSGKLARGALVAVLLGTGVKLLWAA